MGSLSRLSEMQKIMNHYKIFTDATSDLSAVLMNGLAEIEMIPMHIEIGGREYCYGSADGITPQAFYRLERAGNYATTSQINPMIYIQKFEPYLQQGYDILYLCFSSGLSGTYQSSNLAVLELKEKYPERRILSIDTLAAAGGEGFLVREAVKKYMEGFSIEELADWVLEHRLKVCHWFIIDTFEHLKHGGRVNAATAAMGTLLHIKPLLHVDQKGKLEAAGKERGRKKAIAALADCAVQGWTKEMGTSMLIGHSDDLEGAERLKELLLAQCPEAVIEITDIGPIIGAHTGPGAIALFYWGNNR